MLLRHAHVVLVCNSGRFVLVSSINYPKWFCDYVYKRAAASELAVQCHKLLTD